MTAVLHPPTPYYDGGDVQLYHGDCREVLPALGQHYDAAMADPPYGETSLAWDRWPHGWVATVAAVTDSLWCFGSMRMLLERRTDFAAWTFSQDVVWEKHNGSGFAADRFRRVHEHATHWYQGAWSAVHHEVPTTPDAVARQVRRKQRPLHMGQIERGHYVSEDGGPRLARSVLAVRSMHGTALHPTEKPVGLLDPLIRYAVPPGGTVVDPMAGSGSTAVAARLAGRGAVLVEADERYCEIAARRLDQGVLDLGEGA